MEDFTAVCAFETLFWRSRTSRDSEPLYLHAKR